MYLLFQKYIYLNILKRHLNENVFEDSKEAHVASFRVSPGQSVEATEGRL
jgi:hypothetical protein